MGRKKDIVYPYIPNSVQATKADMLRLVDAESVEEFYADIPESIRFKGKLNLPEPFFAIHRGNDGESPLLQADFAGFPKEFVVLDQKDTGIFHLHL